MAVKAIRYWLMRRPRPTFVRVVVGKEVSEMTFDSRTSFARTAESLEAMDADRLEALDAERKLIRATKPAELDDAEQEAEPEEPEAPPPPVGAVASDPETARFVLVANLLADAYKHSTEVAFSKLAEITDRMTRRTESTERTIESLRRFMLAEAQDKLEEAAEREPSLIEQLAGAVAGGIQLGKDGAAPAAPAAPNGKGH
jgi:hypothetical protein